MSVKANVSAGKAFGHAVEAFRNTHPNNPLRKLDDRSRIYVWALLAGYGIYSGGTKKGRAANHPLDRVARIVADAAKLGEKLESEVFRGSFADAVPAFTTGYEDLPTRLSSFSDRLGRFLDSFGKMGHKHAATGTQTLIEVSEFVRLQTGHYYDEHLAELFQTIAHRLPLEQRPSDDLTSDAIRKKRLYAKRHYPELYAGALERAKKASAALPL